MAPTNFVQLNSFGVMTNKCFSANANSSHPISFNMGGGG